MALNYYANVINKLLADNNFSFAYVNSDYLSVF